MVFRKTSFVDNLTGQGTIEYLVILAVVVVISLVIVGLFITLFDSPSQEITGSSSKVGEVAIGGISIVESVIDPAGDSLIRLSNDSSDSITLTRVSVGGVDNNFSEQLVGLDSKVFSLSSLNSNCPCEEGQKNVKCEVKIIYTTSTGIEKTEYRTINVQCVNDSTPVNGNNVVNAIRENCFNINDNPIQICSLQDLNQIRTKLDGNYILMNDINASETSTWNWTIHEPDYQPAFYAFDGWDPIGSYPDDLFVGNFNGNNRTISNLYMYRLYTYELGLFGTVDGGTISNVNLSDINITIFNYGNSNVNIGGLVSYQQGGSISNINVSGNIFCGSSGSRVGGIIGVVSAEAIFTNLNFSGNIFCKEYVGGIVGSGGSISNSSFSGIVSGSLCVGGISGDSSTIDNSHSTGIINSEYGAGGISGCGGGISNSYFDGNVINTRLDGGSEFGGLAGHSGEVRNSYATGIVDGKVAQYVGGLVGSASENIYNSYALSKVYGGRSVGGLVGMSSRKIYNSYFFGDVNGGSNVGGLAGYILDPVYNSYSIGTVRGTDYVGGLYGYQNPGEIGWSEALVSHSFSTASVTGSTHVGGLGGNKNGINAIVTSYWDIFLSGRANCYFDGNTGCSFSNNNVAYYYSSANSPLSSWTWGEDGNWIARAGDYPVLSWQ